MRRLAFAAVAIGAISVATVAPAEARWGGGWHGGWVGPGVGFGLAAGAWPLELPLLLRRTTTDLATATTGRDTTYPDLTLIMAVRFIMDRGTIAGEHLLTGKERARFIRAFLFASL
jgi:hypothetical protein